MKQKTCNRELIDYTAEMTEESTKDVRDAVGFFSRFIADTIKVGAFETVMIPYFGKFQPKTKEIQFKMHRRGFVTTKTNTDAEPIHDNGGLPCGDQQGVDPFDTSLCDDTQE